MVVAGASQHQHQNVVEAVVAATLVISEGDAATEKMGLLEQDSSMAQSGIRMSKKPKKDQKQIYKF